MIEMREGRYDGYDVGSYVLTGAEAGQEHERLEEEERRPRRHFVELASGFTEPVNKKEDKKTT